MLAFVKTAVAGVLIATAIGLWQGKLAERLKQVLEMAGTALVLWLLAVLAVLLGVPIHGVLD